MARWGQTDRTANDTRHQGWLAVAQDENRHTESGGYHRIIWP